MKKQIFEYILRVIVFIFLTGALHEKISTPIMYGMESCFEFSLATIFPSLENIEENLLLIIGLIIGLFSLFMACIGITYIFAKICGIFKKLDNLKKWQGFLVVVLINIIIYLLDEFLDKHRTISYSIRGSITATTLFLIPTYLFYLFLNFLTKKFPKPFEKIGYYTSIEFWKKLIFK